MENTTEKKTDPTYLREKNTVKIEHDRDVEDGRVQTWSLTNGHDRERANRRR